MKASPDQPTTLLLTPEAVSKALGWGRSKTYQLLRRGEIPSVMVHGSRRVRVSDLKAYVDGLATDGASGVLDTLLARRLAPIVRDLWGSDPDAPESAPAQADVAQEAGYRSTRGLEKALRREPGLWKALTARRPAGR